MATHRPYFTCSRLNSTTFVIHEDDEYKEHPFIYVKLYDEVPLIVLSDTGCGGGSHQPYSNNLKDFIENAPIPSNDGKPLNPKPAKKYAIFCTHCHYDHILGLKHFPTSTSTIIASSNDKDFVQRNLAEHSLCKSIGVNVPKYKIAYWAKDYEWYDDAGGDVKLQIIHTPGHTPDELAIYDPEERFLFVGDSFYERVAADKSYEQAILFPKEGSLVDYMKSLDKLIEFVEDKNAEPGQTAIRIGCGHITSAADGLEILNAVKGFFVDILDGKVPVVASEFKRGEEYEVYMPLRGAQRFSMSAPKRLVYDWSMDD